MDIIVSLDQIQWDERGTKNFYWPINYSDILAIRNRLLASLVPFIHTSVAADVRYGKILQMAAGHFVAEIMALYQGYILCRECNAAGHSLRVPPQYRYWNAIEKETVPPPSPFLISLAAGVPRTSNQIKTILRKLRWDLAFNGLTPQIALPFNAKHHIMTLTNAELIHQHAHSISDVVRLSLREDWFPPLAKYRNKVFDDTSLPTEQINFIDSLLDIVNSEFIVTGEGMPEYIAQYIRHWLIEVINTVGSHFDNLLEQSHQIPHRLWTGTSSSIWATLLRSVTRHFGGHVTRHDHGNGLAHLDPQYQQLITFNECDEFVTYNDAQATATELTINPSLILQTQRPRIASAQNFKRPASKSVQPSKSSSSLIHSVMYPATIYDGDRMHLVPLLADVVALDWQVRLFSHLQSWNIQVVHKPHPGGQNFAPAQFAEGFGHRTLLEPFEQVKDQADAYIFDLPQSTTFSIALATDKPVILIDLGFFDWVADARELMEKRCRVVRGWFDAKNRVQVDWDQLHTALTDQRTEQDTSFVDKYCVNTTT
ncbi:MAG: hypothetical protein VYA53_02665 [Acidobacteriota bacterium]|nr:hypothetical protein [Acidobacteriota bacterium]